MMTTEEKTRFDAQINELEKLKKSYLLLLTQVDEMLNIVENSYGKLQRKIRTQTFSIKKYRQKKHRR